MIGAGSFCCKMPAISHRRLLSPRRDTITSKPLQSSKSLAQMSHTRVRSLSNQRDHLNHINFVVQKASLHFPPKLHIRFALYPASNWLRTAGALDSCACWEYISEWGGVRFPLLSPRRPGMVVALNSQVFYTIRLSENGPLFRMEGAPLQRPTLLKQGLFESFY